MEHAASLAVRLRLAEGLLCTDPPRRSRAWAAVRTGPRRASWPRRARSGPPGQLLHEGARSLGKQKGHGRRQEEEGAALVGSGTAGLCVLGFSQLQVDNILEKNPVTAQVCEILLVTIAVVALRSTTDSCVHSISISHWVF